MFLCLLETVKFQYYCSSFILFHVCNPNYKSRGIRCALDGFASLRDKISYNVLNVFRILFMK